MSKLGLFVGVYSVIMFALFFTFCFLMTTVNPPQIKQDPDDSRKYGSDDFIYSDEVLTNDNVAYGLEKADDDYDSIDVFTKTIINKDKNMPTVYIDEGFKTNCSRKEIFKMVTRSMKHIKGLRRSINKESQQDNKIPRSVHFKIKDLDGQPRIEIKVVSEMSKSKNIRKYRSSVNNTNNTLKLNVDNITKYVYDNISKEIIVIIENNENLVLDFVRDSINLYDDKNSASVNDFIINGKGDIELLKDTNISEINTKTYNLDLFKNNTEENVLKNSVTNKTESNVNNIEDTTYCKSMMKSRKNEVKSTAILFNSVNFIDTKTKTELINNSTMESVGTTKTYVPSNDKDKLETNPGVSIPPNTLVGLLIPEATATLPFNYHFIN